MLEVVVDADTSKADSKLSKLGDSGHEWGGRLAMAGTAAFAAVGAAAIGVVGTGVKVAADMETAHVGFETMLGSAKAADSFLKDLQAFAAKTPFEFPELQTAASRLLAVGVNTRDVIPLMTALGDATSGMGTGTDGIERAVAALQKMNTSGKVTAETMQQLTEAGIPAWDALAATLNTTVADAQEKVTAGAVKVGDVMAGIETKAGPAFQRLDGMMAKQSETLSGMFSTLKDTVTMGLADMAAPIVKNLKSSIGPVTDTIGKAMKQLGPVFADVFGGLVNILKELLPALMPVVKVLGEVLGKVFAALAPKIKELAPTIAVLAEKGLEVLMAFMPLLPVFADLAILVANLLTHIPVPVLVGIAAAFLAWQAPVLAVVTVIALLVEAAKQIIEHWGGIAGFFADLWGKIEALFAGAVEWIRSHLALLGTILLTVLLGPLGLLVALFVSHFEQIKTGVANAFGKVVDFVKGIPGKIVGALGNLKDLLVDAGKHVIQGFIDGITRMFGKVKDTLGNLTSKLTSWKGPPATDRRLLHGSGQMVIDGFIAGLESRYADVQASLADLTTTVGGDIGARVTATAIPADAQRAAAAARATAAAAGVTVIQYVAGSVLTEKELIGKARTALIEVGQHNSGGVLGGLG